MVGQEVHKPFGKLLMEQLLGGRSERGDARKHIRGSVSISIAARELSYFDFRVVAWT